MDQPKEGEEERVPGWPEEPLMDPLADPLALDDVEREKLEAHQDEDQRKGDHESETEDQLQTQPEAELMEAEMITVDDVRFSEHSGESEKEDDEEIVKNVASDKEQNEELIENECIEMAENDIGAGDDDGDGEGDNDNSERTPVSDSQNEVEKDSEGGNESNVVDTRLGSEEAGSNGENSESGSPVRNEENNTDNIVGNNGSVSEDSNNVKSEVSKDSQREAGTNDDSLDDVDSDKEQQMGGSDAGDEDDDNKSKRLKAKRRHGSGATDIIAPAPKIKRKCRKNLSEEERDADKERDSEKRKKKDDSRSSDEEDDESESDEDSRWRKLRRRSGAVSGLSAKPKVKNLRRNIRDILSDDKLEDDTLTAQKEEQLRLKRLQEKRVALREYLEQQQVERLVAEVSANLEAGAEVQVTDTTPSDDDIVVLSSEEDAPRIKVELEQIVKQERDRDEEEEEEELEEEEEEEEDDEEEEDEEDEVWKMKWGQDDMFPPVETQLKEISSGEEIKEEEDGEEVEEEEEKPEEDDKELGEKEKSSEEEKSESDSDVVILSSHSEDEEEELEDTSSSGAHINDAFNLPDAQGRVLVNVGHPEGEEDIFLAPQLARVVKPHQTGGIRFLYDNIVESLEQFKTSNGFGCILAHSMGLGKTLQVVSFTDVFLRYTGARTVLIIVPINTLQNWLAEYNAWLPDESAIPPNAPEGYEIWPRKFKTYLLNDSLKNLNQRSKVINEWYELGGVLLMGYELYRQLSLKKPKKPKKKKKDADNKEVVDIEEEDKNKELLEEIQKALVKPGPDLVICDEGHRIKNAHANISQALKNIRTRRRVVLTGYPLQNNLMEYWCMVDFVRPNYLGTKTEFSNMFERPIQNGQCVDSTPQDMKLMRYRAHVLHSLLEGFVQRRGHTVLANTLPMKEEHVLLCRMTEIQRKLYSTFMTELAATKTMANPLKAFAICCKIWNHPDVLYNFVQKKTNEDFDLDLDEVEGKAKSRRASCITTPNPSLLNIPSHPMPSWASPGQMNRNLPQQLGNTGLGMGLQGGMIPTQPGMGQLNMNHQSTMALQQPNMGFPDPMGPPVMHHGMGQLRDNQGGLVGYGMGGHNVHQGYGMQMPYPWYNQGYAAADPRSYSPYNNPYAPQYPQHNTPVSQSLPGYPTGTPNMHNSPMGMGIPNPNQPMGLPSPRQSMGLPNPSGQSMAVHNHSGQALGHPNHSGQSLGVPNPSAQSMGLPNPAGQSMGLPNPNDQSMGVPNSSGQPMGLSNHTGQPMGVPNPSEQSMAVSNPPGQPVAVPNPPGQSVAVPSLSDQSMGVANSSRGPMGVSNPSGQSVGVSNQTGQSIGASNPSGQSLNQPCNNQHGNQAVYPNGPSSHGATSEPSPTTPATPATPATPTTPATPAPSTPTQGMEEKPKEQTEEVDQKLIKKEDIKEEEEENSEDKKDEKKEETKKDEMTFEWTEGLFKDYVPGSLTNSAKFQVFFQILEGCVRVGDRILIFSQSLFTLTLLEEFLQRSYIPGTYEGWLRNRSYFRLDGSTSAQDREKLINEFNVNPNIKLFLVSTRAGSLGINLVGANRVIVFDASFNPCHDTQAVCRVYRYGQKKECHIYRLVTDNSLEKRIYDRQVNKQGISDRILDEMNPDAHLSSKEISNLLVENESDPDPVDMSDKAEKYGDDLLQEVIRLNGSLFTKPPFKHESLLVDRKDKKLSRAEKRLAKRSYELEKQANISYSRPSYAAFYPKNQQGQQVVMGTKIGGVVYAKPVGTVRPLQAEMGQRFEGGGLIHRPNILSRGGQPNFPVEALAKQGVSVQQITVPKDVSIPTNSGDGKPILLKSGQSVMVIKTQKGIYLRLNDGKIVAIRVPPGNEEVFGLPLNKGSVTIVPTIVNSPRPRMQHLGGRGGARRGRPPMAMQYATGNIITKGQMPVRMGKKPLAGIRGGKAYQTITMPVVAGGTTQQALLNKSVVITPATKAGGLSTSKAVRNIKLNPKLTVTTTPKVGTAMSSTTNKVTTATSKGTTTMPSTSGVAGISKLSSTSVIPKLTKKTTLSQLANLHRNEKLRKANQAKKEDKDTGSVKVESDGKSESGEEKELSNELKAETEDNRPSDKELKQEGKVGDEAEGPVNLVNKKEDANNPKKEESEANELAASESGPGQGIESSVGSTNEPTGQGMADQLSDSAASGMSQTTENSSPLPGKQDDKLGSSNTNNSSGLDTSDGGSANLAGDNTSPSLHSNEVVLGAPSKSAVGFGMRDLTKPLSSSVSSSDSRTGIVKPQVQQTPNKPTASLTPLQSMSNLLPPGGQGLPGASHSGLAATTLAHLPSFSSQQAFHSSQPLFQPFLQQTSQQQQQSGGTSSTTNSSSWSKSNVDTVSSSSLGSNVAQVAPHVHQSGMSSSSTYTASQSSFLPSTTHAQFSGSSGNYGTMSTMSSTVPSTTQQSTTATTYPTMSESPQLSQQQHQIQQSQQGSLSSTLSHASGGLVSSSRSGGLGGADSPLNLSHLLNSQVFDSVPEDLSSPHSHASALDYLNYTLSTGTSAFRRPDYQATLSPDLQSLINSATSQQSLSSSLPSAAHSASNPAVSSPSPFPAYQPPTYPQYAPSYRTGTSVSASPYAAYAGQYSPYAAQYPPGLAPHAATTPQPSAMGQYGALHTPPNPYQTYPAPPTPGRSPYSSTLGGFSHGPYPPM